MGLYFSIFNDIIEYRLKLGDVTLDRSILHLNQALGDGLQYIVDVSSAGEKMYSKYSVYSFKDPIDTQSFSIIKDPSDNISIEIDKYDREHPRNFFNLSSKSLFYPAFKNLLESNVSKLGSVNQKGTISILETGNTIQIVCENFEKEDRYMVELKAQDADLFTKKSYVAMENLMNDLNILTSSELAKPMRHKGLR